jgi:hypothetical protein
MQSKWRGLAMLLGCFAGLCTLLAGSVAAFDTWREHVRAGWPVAQAHVSRCEIRELQSSGKDKSYYIRCRLAYVVAGAAIEAKIDSRSVPDPGRVIWQSSGAAKL